MPDKTQFHGWPIVGWSTLAVGFMVGLILLALGLGEPGLRLSIRNTSRTSFVFFVCAFTAPALYALRPSRATAWLRENQAYLFASFFVSHVFHAAAIFTLAALTRGASLADRSLPVIAAGGLVYLFIALAAAPAFPRAARWLDARPKVRALRTFGLYAVWLTFADSYGSRALRSLFHVPFALVLVAALALRLSAPGIRGRAGRRVILPAA